MMAKLRAERARMKFFSSSPAAGRSQRKQPSTSSPVSSRMYFIRQPAQMRCTSSTLTALGHLRRHLTDEVGEGNVAPVVAFAGAQTDRAGAGVVLGEDGEEALDRPVQGAVDHEGLVRLVVGADVGDAEALRRLEVHLDGRELPAPTDGIAQVHADLGRIEGALTLAVHVGD